MAPMASMASMELRAGLSPAPRGPPDRYHRKKRFLLTPVPPPASLTEMTCTNDGVDDGSQRELTTKASLAEGAASARDASTARQNRHNRQIYPALHMSFRAAPAKNGAPLSIWRVRRRARQPGSMNVRSGRRACCNRVQSPRRTAKWRFGPPKKRHFAPFSPTFSSIFPVFYQRAWPEWRFARECDPEVRFSCLAIASSANSRFTWGPRRIELNRVASATSATFRNRLHRKLLQRLVSHASHAQAHARRFPSSVIDRAELTHEKARSRQFLIAPGPLGGRDSWCAWDQSLNPSLAHDHLLNRNLPLSLTRLWALTAGRVRVD
jgi:hypothetical protein